MPKPQPASSCRELQMSINKTLSCARVHPIAGLALLEGRDDPYRVPIVLQGDDRPDWPALPRADLFAAGTRSLWMTARDLATMTVRCSATRSRLLP